jgi:hypothetical protein
MNELAGVRRFGSIVKFESRFGFYLKNIIARAHTYDRIFICAFFYNYSGDKLKNYF